MKISLFIPQNRKVTTFETEIAKTCTRLGHSVRLIEITSNDIFYKSDGNAAWIFRMLHNQYEKYLGWLFLNTAKYRSIQSYPNYNTAWHYDDKNAQDVLMNIASIKVIPTSVFYSYETAVSSLLECDYPLVFKLKSGAGSSNVSLVRNEKNARRIAKRMFAGGLYSGQGYGKMKYYYRLKRWFAYSRRILVSNPSPERNYLYIQKYIPNAKYDLRITVIGDRGYAFKRYNRPNDFRASGSGLIDYNIDDSDIGLISMLINYSKDRGFQTMAYDIIKDTEGTAYCNEMSYTFDDVAINECSTYYDIYGSSHTARDNVYEAIEKEVLRRMI